MCWIYEAILHTTSPDVLLARFLLQTTLLETLHEDRKRDAEEKPLEKQQSVCTGCGTFSSNGHKGATRSGRKYRRMIVTCGWEGALYSLHQNVCKLLNALWRLHKKKTELDLLAPRVHTMQRNCNCLEIMCVFVCVSGCHDGRGRSVTNCVCMDEWKEKKLEKQG